VIRKVRQLLALKPNEISHSTSSSVVFGVRRSFEELEKCRPGTIFSLLGQGTTTTNSEGSHTWLFPSKVSTPIFGSVLGLDGFRTCKMMYQKQEIRVPIDREGSVAQAAVRGFSRLVTPSYSFTLIRTGDFHFDVAPSPDETCEQVFVKSKNGKLISLHVPLKKALLRFIKVLIGEREALSFAQQRFIVADKHIGDEADDDLPLTQCNIKAASTMHLIVK